MTRIRHRAVRVVTYGRTRTELQEQSRSSQVRGLMRSQVFAGQVYVTRCKNRPISSRWRWTPPHAAGTAAVSRFRPAARAKEGPVSTVADGGPERCGCAPGGPVGRGRLVSDLALVVIVLLILHGTPVRDIESLLVAVSLVAARTDSAWPRRAESR